MTRAMLLLSIVAALACSTKEAEPGSCYREHDNACVEHPAAQAAAGKRMCSGMKWTAGAGSCPAANRVGTCAKNGGAEHLYGGAPNNYNAASAKSACEHGGGIFTLAASSAAR